MKLSLLMPAYNEAATIVTAIERVLHAEYPCEIELVVVDDGSSDATPQLLAGIEDPRVVRARHAQNRGKGAAVRTAASMATGDYMLIFDADLEYSPEDVSGVLGPVLRGDAEVVFGTRTFGSHSAHSFWFVIGNKVTTFAANALYNSWISDLHTCLKLLPLQLFRELDTRQNGFGLDAEITAKVLARGIRPYEVPISYLARSHEEGKKITWWDGVLTLWILLAVRTSTAARRRVLVKPAA